MAAPARCQLSEEMRITDTYTVCVVCKYTLIVLVHILSPVTDNCPPWISGRERLAVEITSWPNSLKECCASDRATMPGLPLFYEWCEHKNWELFTQQSLISLSINLNSLSWVLYWLLRAQSCPSWSEYLPSTCHFVTMRCLIWATSWENLSLGFLAGV